MAACAAGTAGAQSLDYAALEQLLGEPVTTSVTGSPQRASDVPATLVIITADEIRRSGARDIPGVLRHVAGVDVMRTSKDHADVSVRGYNQVFSPRLLVLLDGRQVYADYYGFTPWSTVPIELDAIRQIEIVKGPNSALFGFNAVGGVVNIVTYDPLYDTARAAAATAGTQDLVQASAVSTWRFGDKAGLRISAGTRTGDDFDTPQTPVEIGSRRGNDREAVNVAAGVRLTDAVELRVEGTHSRAAQTEFAPTYYASYGDYEVDSLRAGVAAEVPWGLLQATVYQNQNVTTVFVGDAVESFIDFDNQVTVARIESLSKLGTRHTLRFSAEHRDNTMDTTPLAGAEVFYDVGALAAMWEWRMTDRWTLTGAYRADRWSLGREGLIPPGLPIDNSDWDRTSTDRSYHFGLVGRLSEEDVLRFTVAEGVQVPNLLHLGGLLLPFPPLGYVTGASDLEPTRVQSAEVAWDRGLPALGATLTAAIFHGHTRDPVAGGGRSNFAAGILSMSTNLDESNTAGLDLSIRGTIGDAWRWSASYLRQRVTDELGPLPAQFTLVDFEHTTPDRVLTASVGWTRGPWEVDGYARHQSRFAQFAFNPRPFGYALAPVPSYVALDARVGYRLSSRMTLALSGQNLGRSPQRQSTSADVERTVLASLTMRFAN